LDRTCDRDNGRTLWSGQEGFAQGIDLLIDDIHPQLFHVRLREHPGAEREETSSGLAFGGGTREKITRDLSIRNRSNGLSLSKLSIT